MTFLDWWHRHFTRLGRDIAWRERYARRRGHAYPGHVPPRPMPAPSPSVDAISERWQRAGFEKELSDRIEAALEARHVPRPGPWPDPPPSAPPRPRYHRMLIVAGEPIAAGVAIQLEEDDAGQYVAWARTWPRGTGSRHA